MKVNPVRKAIPDALVSLDAPQRRLIGVASTSLRDRQGDVVEAAGWELGNYLANPVIIWAHDYGRPALAKALRVWVEGDRLLFEAQFPPEGDYPFADTIYSLYHAGVLRAFSAGFNPLESSPIEGGGKHYRRQELFEISCANIPVNPQALAEIVKALGQVDANQTHQGDESMNLLQKLRELFGLAAEAPEAEVIASAEKVKAVVDAVVKALSLDPAQVEPVAVVKAMSAIRGKPESQGALPPALLQELGLAIDASQAQVLGVVKALKQGRDQAQDLAAQLAEVKKRLDQDAAERAVAKAMKDGKIAPAQRDWALDYAVKDLAGFEAYAKAAPVVIPVKDLPGGPAKGSGPDGLDEVQKGINAMLGIDAETFKKHNPASEEV